LVDLTDADQHGRPRIDGQCASRGEQLDRLVKTKSTVRAAYNPLIDASDPGATPAILFVCTGNICRSPMAEGILRARLAAKGIAGTVASAGIAFDGREATPEAIAVASRSGIDITAHRSRIISADMVAAADLVIGMERMHVREAIVLGRNTFTKCFTLKEFVRRGASVGPRAAGEPLDRWLDRASAGRRPLDLLGDADADDVADPYRHPPAVYERCIDEIDDNVGQLVSLAWPAASEGVA